jgi:hypothetical protein
LGSRFAATHIADITRGLIVTGTGEDLKLHLTKRRPLGVRRQHQRISLASSTENISGRLQFHWT